MSKQQYLDFRFLKQDVLKIVVIIFMASKKKCAVLAQVENKCTRDCIQQSRNYLESEQQFEMFKKVIL